MLIMEDMLEGRRKTWKEEILSSRQDEAKNSLSIFIFPSYKYIYF